LAGLEGSTPSLTVLKIIFILLGINS